jgi:hypothetical protein
MTQNSRVIHALCCFQSHITVVQDAWSRIRLEQTQFLEAADSDSNIAELARSTQAQLGGIVRDCSESVFQLRSSMSDDIEIVRSSVESVQGQLDALKHDLSSQLQAQNAEAVTPGILAAAISALERHVNEYFPENTTLHSVSLKLPSDVFSQPANRSKAEIELRIDVECEDRERKIDALDAQLARFYRTRNEAS